MRRLLEEGVVGEAAEHGCPVKRFSGTPGVGSSVSIAVMHAAASAAMAPATATMAVSVTMTAEIPSKWRRGRWRGRRVSGRFCVHGFGRDPRDVVTLFDARALAFIVGAAVIAAGMPGMPSTSLTPGLARFSIRVCRPGMLVMVVRGRAVEGNKVIPHGRGEESCPKWMRGGGKVLVVDAVTRGTTVEASLVVGRKERPRKWRRWRRRLLLLLLAAAGVVLIVLCRHGGDVFFQSREGKEFVRNFARVIVDAGRSIGSAAETRCRKRLIYMPPHSMSRDVRACACSPASPVFRQCASHAITQAGKLASRIGFFFCVCVWQNTPEFRKLGWLP